MKSSAPNKIHLFKEDREIDCPSDSSILDANLNAGIDHAHACGGNAQCSTCKVVIMAGIDNCNPRTTEEKVIADKMNFPPEVRLACQTHITGNVAIRRIVSDELDMDIILKQFSPDSDIALGSQQKLTIVFTDIVNYTSFAEKFPTYDIVHVLYRYYDIMNTVIQENNGIISDVAGDGILAVFGTDTKNKNSVLDAIKAIEGMNAKLELFNVYLKNNFNISFGIRAGVHHGNVVIGPFDTGAMKKMAVIGDNVNYASRIEAANKEFGTKVLLSEEAYDEVRNEFPNHNTYEAELKGKTGAYKLYELV